MREESEEKISIVATGDTASLEQQFQILQTALQGDDVKTLDCRIQDLEDMLKKLDSQVTMHSEQLVTTDVSQQELREKVSVESGKLCALEQELNEITVALALDDSIKMSAQELEQQINDIQTQVDQIPGAQKQLAEESKEIDVLTESLTQLPVLEERQSALQALISSEQTQQEAQLQQFFTLFNKLPTRAEIDACSGQIDKAKQHISSSRAVESERAKSMFVKKAEALAAHNAALQNTEAARAKFVNDASACANSHRHSHQNRGLLVCARPSETHGKMFWSEVRVVSATDTPTSKLTVT